MSYPLFLNCNNCNVMDSAVISWKFCGKVVKCHNSFVYTGFAHVGGRAFIVIHVRKTIIHFTHRKNIELYYY